MSSSAQRRYRPCLAPRPARQSRERTCPAWPTPRRRSRRSCWPKTCRWLDWLANRRAGEGDLIAVGVAQGDLVDAVFLRLRVGGVLAPGAQIANQIVHGPDPQIDHRLGIAR